MRTIISLISLFSHITLFAQAPILQDNFEGSGGIASWYGDDCVVNTSVNNPYPAGINSSAKVLRYSDVGGLYANVAFKYGRVEARAKLPTGAGTWPAIWMLGKNIIEPGAYWTATHGTINWPACGEIDIMEHWGKNQNVISSAVHHPINGNLNIGEYTDHAQYDPNVSSEFHVYAVEWNEQSITFSVNGINHLSYNPPIKNQYSWPFNAEQYLLLNVAIEPSVTQNFVQSSMEVDYVRVYQGSALNAANTTNRPQIKLFPNPVTDNLNIAGIEDTNTSAEVYSILGQKIHACVLKEEDTNIDVSNFKNGVYLLVLISNTGMDTYKIVKN